jgi:hypothetical protein
VNELDEASKKVYSPETGEARGVIAGTSTIGGSSDPSMIVAVDDSDTKTVGSIFIILDGWTGES